MLRSASSAAWPGFANSPSAGTMVCSAVSSGLRALTAAARPAWHRSLPTVPMAPARMRTDGLSAAAFDSLSPACAHVTGLTASSAFTLR